MKVINVSLSVKPGKESEYEAFIDKLVQGSLAEAGNLDYGHFKKLGTDDEYEIIEHWKDAAAVESHNGTAHFQEFLAHVGDYVTKDPEIIRMDN
ncbi:putative quinol monooxygenase [Companilactobacillus ginsenosidimutans]|uniref:Antibiotic biosynthesis monooxygenase n=1 Tax=Companilactobacillus ginsenosidimutans TaxID=1007676 RepID=A0A0H4QLT0_9LACO|nr:putative quinol monooxygenase [Companilactobacillus ginsenosidimutans]AKP67658.1 antibiotic biosynthesis monooxygenase [Companilactobacillus ginsenosidimutans]